MELFRFPFTAAQIPSQTFYSFINISKMTVSKVTCATTLVENNKLCNYCDLNETVRGENCKDTL